MVKQSPYDRFEQRAKTVGQAAVMILFSVVSLGALALWTWAAGDQWGFWGYFVVPIVLLGLLVARAALLALEILFEKVTAPIRKAWRVKKQAWYEKNRD